VCFFFVSVITVWGSKTTSIFFNSILFDGKVNLVGALERSKFKIPNSFQKRQEKQHKNEGKTEIFTQKRFSIKSILVIDATLKQVNEKQMTILLNVYIFIFYTS